MRPALLVMDGDRDIAQSARAHDDQRIAVVDIGSNSVRLVVYNGRGRASQAIFNEKTPCGLDAGVSHDGRLSDAAMTCVTKALERFVRVARALDVKEIDAFATAATREAENGAELIGRIKDSSGINVAILSGEEEGRLSAEGVLASIPGADGAMGDLGGGSLELVALDGGATGACATLPLGVLRLVADHGGDLAAIEKAIRKAVSGVSWFTGTKGRTFVAVGGAWRALARYYMNATNAPLHIVQGLTVEAPRLRKFLADVVKGVNQRDSAARGLSRRRIETLPIAAALLAAVIDRGKPGQVMFSAYGVREGRLMQHLTLREHARDPLYASCAEISADTPRFRMSADEVFHWMSALFPHETMKWQRMRYAACLVGDIGWREHPDYRPQLVFRRLLLMPAAGIDHVGRAYLATAVFARYTNHIDASCLKTARALISSAEFDAACMVGGALRLAYEMSGGDPEVLRLTRLERGTEKLVLHVNESVTSLIGGSAGRRLGQLARRGGLTGVIRPVADSTAA